MAEIEWADPPPPAPRRADLVAAQLRGKPNEWARIDSGATTLLPWWMPISNDPNFELKFVRTGPSTQLFGPRDVYARYIGKES